MAAGLDLTGSWAGVLSLLVFGVAYLLVVLEEVTGMAKSKPVLLAAGVIWGLIGVDHRDGAGGSRACGGVGGD